MAAHEVDGDVRVTATATFATPARAGLRPSRGVQQHGWSLDDTAAMARALCSPPEFLLACVAVKGVEHDSDQVVSVVHAALAATACSGITHDFLCSLVRRDVTDADVLSGAFGPGAPEYLSAATMHMFAAYAQTLDPGFLITALGSCVDAVVTRESVTELEVSPLLADVTQLGACVTALSDVFEALVTTLAESAIYFPRQLRALCKYVAEAVAAADCNGARGYGHDPSGGDRGQYRDGDGAGAGAGANVAAGVGVRAGSGSRSADTDARAGAGAAAGGQVDGDGYGAAAAPVWTVLGRLVFGAWVCPALRYPWLYGVVDEEPSVEAQRVLWYLADALEAATTGQESPTTPFLACLNVTIAGLAPAVRDMIISMGCVSPAEFNSAHAGGNRPAWAAGDGAGVVSAGKAAPVHAAQRLVRVGTLVAPHVSVSASDARLSVIALQQFVAGNVPSLVSQLTDMRQQYAAAGATGMAVQCSLLASQLEESGVARTGQPRQAGLRKSRTMSVEQPGAVVSGSLVAPDPRLATLSKVGAGGLGHKDGAGNPRVFRASPSFDGGEGVGSPGFAPAAPHLRVQARPRASTDVSVASSAALGLPGHLPMLQSSPGVGDDADEEADGSGMLSGGGGGRAADGDLGEGAGSGGDDPTASGQQHPQGTSVPRAGSGNTLGGATTASDGHRSNPDGGPLKDDPFARESPQPRPHGLGLRRNSSGTSNRSAGNPGGSSRRGSGGSGGRLSSDAAAAAAQLSMARDDLGAGAGAGAGADNAEAAHRRPRVALPGPSAVVQPVAQRAGEGWGEGGEDVPGDLPQFITTDFATPTARDRDDDSEVGSPWLSVSQRMPRGHSAAAAMLAARRAIAEAHAAEAAQPQAWDGDGQRMRRGEGLSAGGGFAFKVGPSGAAPVVYTVAEGGPNVNERLVVPDATRGGAGSPAAPYGAHDSDASAKPGHTRPGVSSATLSGMAAGVIGATFQALLASGQLGGADHGKPSSASSAHDAEAGTSTASPSGGASGRAGGDTSSYGRRAHVARTWVPPPATQSRSPPASGVGGAGGVFESRAAPTAAYSSPAASQQPQQHAIAAGAGRPTIGASGAGLGDVKLSVPAPRRRRASVASSSGRSAAESPSFGSRPAQHDVSRARQQQLLKAKATR